MIEEYAQAHASGWGDFTIDTVADLLGHPRATTPQRSPGSMIAETVTLSLDRKPLACPAAGAVNITDVTSGTEGTSDD